jgi:hypothetical protein
MIGQLLYECIETSVARQDICGNGVVLVTCQEAWRDWVAGWLGYEGRLGKVSKNNDETVDECIEGCLSCGSRIYSIIEPS